MMSPQYSLVAIVAVALIAGVSEASPPQKIVDGDEAAPGEFPYQVQLKCNNFNCGGAIISSRHVLTAGHCVEHCNTNPFTGLVVRTGSTLADEGNTHTVTSVTRHPRYETRGTAAIHDLAIIALRESMTFDAYQNKVELPFRYTPNALVVNVTGWGLTNSDNGLLPYHLHKVRVLTAHFSDWKPVTPGGETDKMFIGTVGPYGTGTCMGDSGGPVVRYGILIGIVSLGEEPCGRGSPDTHVQVYHYIDWIRGILSST